MIFTTLLTALCAASSVAAAPLQLRQSNKGTSGSSHNGNGGNNNNGNNNGNNGNNVDLQVLQFAHVLEGLETQFYTQALSKFQTADFTNAGFTNAQVPIEQFTAIAADEKSHTTALESAINALGGQPITSCNFDFSSVLGDVATMSATARAVENVGVSAYLGAAGLITDPNILNAAASIATIEARHQTILNMLNDGTTIPQSFDVPLTPTEVLTIAGGFISGCDLGIAANPTLTVTNTGAVNVGTLLTTSSSAFSGVDPNTLTCQMLVGGQATALAFPLSQCVVPPGVNGPVYLFVTSSSQPLANDPLIRDSSDIVAGPTVAFIDSTVQTVSTLVRTPSSNNAPAPNVATNTITPSSATSVASGAAPTSTAPAQAPAPPPAAATPPPAPAGPVTPIGFTSAPADPSATPAPAPAPAPANVGSPSAPAPQACSPVCPIGTTTTS
jgi:rubrerythrin